MTRIAHQIGAVFAVTVALAVGVPAPGALAQQQSIDQRRCLVDMGARAALVAKARGKENSKCLVALFKGKLRYPTAADCLAHETVKSVAKARISLLQTQASSCRVLPDFGFAGADAAYRAAFDEVNALTVDLLGETLEEALGDKAVTKCQRVSMKAWDRLVQARLRVFSDCKRRVLTEPAVTSAATLAQRCFDEIEADPRGRILKALAQVTRSVAGACAPTSVSIPLGGVFPGTCAVEGLTGTALASCVEQRVGCRTCRMLAGFDALETDCDLVDDGEANESCETPPPPTTTTTMSSTTTTTDTSTTTTTMGLCSPGPDCSSLDEACRLGVCNPLNGACTYANVVAGTPCASAPADAVLANFTVTDLGDPNELVDTGAGDVREWSRTISQEASPTIAAARLAAAVGARACCTLDDESITKTAAYRVEFDVVAGGDWRLDLAHALRGAYSIIDRKVALEDAGGSASISAVSATYSVNGAAPVAFGFTPAPASKSHAIGGGEGTTDTPFEGDADARVHGSGNASVVVEFSFVVSAHSDSNAAFPAAAGDEVAIRLGRADSIATDFTAGAYPSGHGALGSRDIDADGHFFTAALVSFSCLAAGECNGTGSCVAPPALDCGGLDAECRVGVCDAGTQSCVQEDLPDGAACDDGDLCTVGDACEGGACQQGTPRDCSNLDDACNDGACDAGSGDCVALPRDAGTVCAAPQAGARLAGVTVEDLSTPDTKLDGAGDVHEWRHAVSLGFDLDEIEASLKGMLGADACCTVEDESLSATARYRVSFEVEASADWELEIGHRILGAFSILDEKVALEDAGGSATIGAIAATYSIDGDAPVAFGFSPSPSSLVHALGGGEGHSDVEFSGAAFATIVGSGDASVVLEFEFAMTAYSDSNAAFPAAGGDEVAIRLGMSDTIANGFTAGQYPSGHAALGARDIDADGHFVRVRLRTAICAGEAQCDGSGACVGGTTDCATLDDACGRGICDVDTAGCAYEPFAAGVECSDGDACNGLETCDGAGSCEAGTPVDCSAFDGPCHDGVCAPGSGACSAAGKADATPCDDGDACTDDDVCTAGVCAGTPLPGCGATIANAVLTDLSTADFKVDGGFDVHEWIHTVTMDAGETAIAAGLRGMAGADACCTVDDETITPTASYRVTFDVVSDMNWRLSLAHHILGAFSLLDEKVALEDAGGTASITAVSATCKIGAAAPVAFGFTPVPSSRTHALNGGEGHSDVQFTGSSSTTVDGSGSTTVVVEIHFVLTAFSNSNAAFPAAGGDEVAIRLGMSDTITNGFTAGQYPSGHPALGARDIDLDGHFLSLSIEGMP